MDNSAQECGNSIANTLEFRASKNKANLTDLIAATSLVILALKLD